MTVRQALSLGVGVCVAAFLAACGWSGGAGGPSSPAAARNGSAAARGLGPASATIDATDALVFDPHYVDGDRDQHDCPEGQPIERRG